MTEADELIYRHYSTVTQLDYGNNDSNVISFYDNSKNSIGGIIKLDTGVRADNCDVQVTDAMTMFVPNDTDMSGVTILGFACLKCPYNPAVKSSIGSAEKCKAVYVKKPNHKLI